MRIRIPHPFPVLSGGYLSTQIEPDEYLSVDYKPEPLEELIRARDSWLLIDARPEAFAAGIGAYLSIFVKIVLRSSEPNRIVLTHWGLDSSFEVFGLPVHYSNRLSTYQVCVLGSGLSLARWAAEERRQNASKP